MATEVPTGGWNPWISVHLPLAFTAPPGSSSSCDALRISILTVGAVHLRFLHDPVDQDAVLKVARTGRTRALKLIEGVQTGLASSKRESKDHKLEHELVLNALLSCTIASVSRHVYSAVLLSFRLTECAESGRRWLMGWYSDVCDCSYQFHWRGSTSFTNGLSDPPLTPSILSRATRHTRSLWHHVDRSTTQPLE